MQVILLERLENYGQMGDEVRVKDGFARNFLLPQKKALRATEENRKYFESQRKEIEATNLERKAEAEKVAEKLIGKSVILIRQAGDTGQLYGSVSTRDITEALKGDEAVNVKRNQVVLDRPIKTLGVHDLRIVLHGEVSVIIQVNVARSQQEAELQAQGIDIDAERREQEAAEAAEAAAQRAAAANALFEEGTLPGEETAEDATAEDADKE